MFLVKNLFNGGLITNGRGTLERFATLSEAEQRVRKAQKLIFVERGVHRAFKIIHENERRM